VVPAKILPTFVAKIEEFKKHRNAENTLSQKKLLKDSDEDDGNSQSSPENESAHTVSSSQEIQKPKEETVAQVTAAEKLSRVAPMPNSEGKITEENHPDKDNTEQVNTDMDPNQEKLNLVVEMVEAEVKTEEEKSEKLEEEAREEKDEEMGAKGDDEHDDDSYDEDKSEEVGRLLCPGSPSFRIYCIEPEKVKESECEYQKN